MEIPESMKSELAAWNNGAGIDLESWTGCEGRFALAVGYAAIFWPEFVEFEGYTVGPSIIALIARTYRRRGFSWHRQLTRMARSQSATPSR
jgi:hypothetical protein